VSDDKPTHTVLTWEEWRARVAAASETAKELTAIVENMTTGPGQSVLALMIAARALCMAYPPLPPFEWYFRRVADLFDVARPPPREREPPS
jgi:hypothetical protein